jgi:hypothetical protein
MLFHAETAKTNPQFTNRMEDSNLSHRDATAATAARWYECLDEFRGRVSLAGEVKIL